MIKKLKSNYGFEETIERLKKFALEYGWSISGEHNPGKYHNKNLRNIEICKSEYAKKILEKEENFWVVPMMPCRISVCEEKDGVYVYVMNLKLMSKFLIGDIKKIFKKAIMEEEEIIEKAIK